MSESPTVIGVSGVLGGPCCSSDDNDDDEDDWSDDDPGAESSVDVGLGESDILVNFKTDLNDTKIEYGNYQFMLLKCERE
jgi:hypothetical protein